MSAYNLVAVYQDRSTAEEVRSELQSLGVPQDHIRLSARGSREDVAPSSGQKSEGGFLDWLFGGDDVSADERNWYQNLGERTAVSVRVEDAQVDRVRDTLDDYNPVEMDVEARGKAGSTDALGGSTGMGYQPGVQGSSTASSMGRSSGSLADSKNVSGQETEEQVIPLTKEELEVGKRTRESRHRIRTYTVERPVEKSIPLRDERVVIERRPATGPAMGSGHSLQGREYEVVERHEEPVVNKKVASNEEVVIRKDVSDRTETVRDTVRETEIEHDQDQLRGADPRGDMGKKS
jgi:stress response protein YsnF